MQRQGYPSGVQLGAITSNVVGNQYDCDPVGTDRCDPSHRPSQHLASSIACSQRRQRSSEMDQCRAIQRWLFAEMFGHVTPIAGVRVGITIGKKVVVKADQIRGASECEVGGNKCRCGAVYSEFMGGVCC